VEKADQKAQNYTHLTLEEREILYKNKALGKSFRSIGLVLCRSHTTLIREYRRNAKYEEEYIPCRAHNKAIKRGNEQRWKSPLKNPEILLFVRENLRKGLSPEIISGLLRLQNVPAKSISPEAIYQYIYHKDNRRDHFEQYLPLKRKKRMKKGERTVRRHGKIPNALCIEQRPEEINLRNRYGDWETDLMEGTKADRQVILVSIERKSRYIKLTRLNTKESKKYMQAQINQMQYLPVLTITSDNGLENVKHQEVSQALKADYYFCHAYSSWEKGSVENVIKLIRRFISKGTEISKHTDAQIQEIEDFINNYPRKLHNYLTPKQILEMEGIKV
jgi:IS30 family transposase